MKTKSSKGIAVVGRNVTLSTIECLVLNELTNKLTLNLPDDGCVNDTPIECNAGDLIDLANFMAKLTGEQGLSIEEAKGDLFCLSEEDVLFEDTTPPTSSVEASDKPRIIGKIPLTRKDINDLEEDA